VNNKVISHKVGVFDNFVPAVGLNKSYVCQLYYVLVIKYKKSEIGKPG